MKTKRKKIIDKLDELVKTNVKKRDNYTCQKCFKRVSGSNAHASHVIPVSRGNALRWDMQNIKTLCFHCHINWWHKHPTESGEWFKKTFPDRWAYLEKRKYQMVKYSVIDLEELYNKLKENI